MFALLLVVILSIPLQLANTVAEYVAWCLVEDREQLNRRPTKNHTTGLYQVDWYDADYRVLRKITSRLYRESWTQIDPERENKKVHDERLRITMARKAKGVDE